jgi:DNA-binding CsgD family transcriptional regulator
LVGRGVEEGQLRELVREVAAGVGGSVVVEGEPGIGKSSLVSAGLAEAAGLGCRVLRGAADEFAGRFPLRVLLDCFVNARVADVPGLPGGEPGSTLSSSYDPVLATMERLIGAVDKLCAESPVVLAVDDLQWADEPSLAVWGELSRSVAQLPLLLVAACRTEPLRAEAAKARRTLEAQGAVVVRLGPLSRPETVALVRELVGAPPGPGLTRLAVRAGGNPLYVRELVDVLVREGRLRVEPGVAAEVAGGGEVAVPVSLRAAIADRIGSMSDATQRMVRMAALLGAEFSAADLAAVLGRPAPDLAEALMEAYRTDVLVDSGTRTAFRHPLIRQAVYEAVPPGMRAVLHRQTAQALAEAGAPVERVGEQLQAALGVTDSWALGWLADNSAALVNRAAQSAIELLSRAADDVPRADPRREVIESLLVMALQRMLRFDEVRQRTRVVLADSGISAGHRLEMSWALAHSLLYSDAAQAVQVAREALASDEGSRWGARLLGLLAWVLVRDRHVGDAETAICKAHAAAQQTGDAWAMAYIRNVESIVVGQRDTRAAADLLRHGLAAIGDDPQACDLRSVLVNNLTFYLDELGLHDETDAVLADMQAFVEKFPTAMAVNRVQVYAAEWHYDVGRWDDVVAELESVEVRPEQGSLAVEALSIGALVAGHRDDRAGAAAKLGLLATMPIADHILHNDSGRLFLARALAAERDGQPDRAVGMLAPMLELDVEPHHRMRWLAELVRLALATGEHDIAEAATNLAVAHADREPLTWRVAVATECRGLLAADPALLLDAADRFGTACRILDRGVALENAAVLLAARNDLPPARAALTAALQEYDKLGAAWDITRAEARMRPFGIRRGQRGPRGPRDRPASGWDALTRTELRIASYVADGLSNPAIARELYLSRRTVQSHVSHILVKLNARSRVEIASTATRAAANTPVRRSQVNGGTSG